MYCEKLKSTPTTSRLNRSLICAINFCTPWPLAGRLQRHEEFREKGAVRIGAVLTAALLGKHRPHRIVAADNVADTCNGLYTAVERDRRRHHPADPKVALFELWQKLCAQPGAEESADCKKCHRDRRRQTVMAHGERQNELIDLADLPHH